jgi:hypothetical protein
VRRVVDIFPVLAFSLVLGVAPAWASGKSQVTDPNANSPAGVVYSIPLDSARQDASPHHGGTGVGGGGGGSGHGQSGVGGASGSGGSGSGGSGSGGSGSGSSAGGSGGQGSAGQGNARGGRDGQGAVLVTGGQPGSLIHSSNGFGSSSSIPGLNAPTSAGLSAVQGNGDSAPPLAIMLAIVVMAIGVYAGVRTRRASRPESPPSPL